MNNENYDVSQVRCTSIINVANKYVFFCKDKTNNGNVRVYDRYVDGFL